MRSKNDTVGTIMLRLTLVLILSLLLHLSMYTVVKYAPAQGKPANITEIEIINSKDDAKTAQNKDFEKPVIKNSTETKPQDIDKPADFVAEKHQRFEQQTRAAQNGVFQNASPQIPKPAKKQPTENTKKPASEQRPQDGDLPEFAQAIQKDTQAVQQQFNTQTSSSPYDLPRDINIGLATNLNADAHIYATFYNRVVDLFYVRWSQNLEYIFDRLPIDMKRQLSGKNWSTELEVFLNSEGVYQKGFILKNSGFKPFDDAGLNAFKDAKVFPNPPRGKIESDGFVKLKYRILVQVR